MQKLTTIELLGKTIQFTRKKQKLTQRQLSAICGVGERFIRELEHGKESCHIGKALQVTSMLGIQIFIETESTDK